ncbi:hypothetical protein DRF75_00765 [Ehrlichia minasensis]|uniref:Uncharacterized protein n=1 Tax=Ehrlichia minasensis TaxID=1242993 RepID=A0A4Q6I8M8_9RICK|nr:hypothetical protein [Ehrlichia minasensis]RZB13009.1 hypothetical protein DRF75_00765 [Ehrlichia minasensis]CEI85466.1 Uncharacterized protein ehr_00862 [Ehrlichia minasensis]
MPLSLSKKNNNEVATSNKEKSIALLKMFVKDIRKVAAKSCYKIPKEQQVSMDIFNKPILSSTGTEIVATDEHKVVYGEIKSKNEQDSQILYRGSLICVKWFSLMEQYHNTVIIKGNNELGFALYSYDGKLYDTSGKKVAYVLTLAGNLITHDHIVRDHTKGKTYFHSTLAAGMPVMCAGLVSVDQGIIVDISNESGHYKPSVANLYNAVKLLDRVISVDSVIRIMGFTIDSKSKGLRAFYKMRMKGSFLSDMETVGEDGLTIPQRCFALLKKYDDDYKRTIAKTLVKNQTAQVSDTLVQCCSKDACVSDRICCM